MNALECPTVNSPALFTNLCRGLVALAWGAVTQAQVPASPLEIKSIAEVESRSVQSGHAVVKLIPADRVAPGDRVSYTLEVRNTGAAPIAAPIVTYAIPEHMRYVADSAV